MANTQARKRSAAIAFLVCCASFLVPASPAAAYGAGAVSWPVGLSGQYCLGSTATAHTSWPGYISTAVTQYNNITGYPRPYWSRSCGPGYQINIHVSSLPVGLCGATSHTPPQTGTLTSADISYTTRYGYVRGVPGTATSCNFDYVTTHEFGHSQGMPHGCVASAVMYGYDKGISVLTSDDKYSHRWLYDPNFIGPPSPDSSCA
ncbi:matrixin family metalloprotease [Nakamurella sp. UYEF19]|uniref:matrixin family metalloprotease n=1 Tax=Nakamurella sp. UYEF19 TaxID=1756392 RepID=UPI0033984247